MRILFVNPWNYHDENIKEHDLSQEWRNGPYSLLLLATLLKNEGHDVIVEDMHRNLVKNAGDVEQTLLNLQQSLSEFLPELIAFSFFSIHYFEVKQTVEYIKKILKELDISPYLIAGGIHASTDPRDTIDNLGFDYAFLGEGEISLLKFVNGCDPEMIQGVYSKNNREIKKCEEVMDLDSLPFPNWSLIDYQFYAYPSYAKVKYRKAKTLDMIMGRGCVFSCQFCAYNALSSSRAQSGKYLIEQLEEMISKYGIDSVYFTDSTVGNYKKSLIEFCNLMIEKKLNLTIEWYVNLHPNQASEDMLRLMYQAGCRFWLYGFESGSQNILNAMQKGSKIERHYKVAQLHNQLNYLYHASFIVGYIGETADDVQQTMQFIEDTAPPLIGINAYVPLPGSPDFDKMKSAGLITMDDPMEWRKVGEVNIEKCYALYDLPELKKHYQDLNTRANEISREVQTRSWKNVFWKHKE